MTTKIISGTITGGYTLSPTYNRLSITSTGEVTGATGEYGRQNGGVGGAGVTLPTYDTAINSGSITGGVGGGAYYYGGKGGAGVAAAGGMVVNKGSIIGGKGGNGTDDSDNHNVAGGYGGTGVSLSENGTVTNSGLITGGVGGEVRVGVGAYVASGFGGVGVWLYDGGLVSNSGLITGGVDDSPGVLTTHTAATIDNYGSITGGAGIYRTGEGSPGGRGVELLSGGMVTNNGTITGGAGGANGGFGGTAVQIYGTGTIINKGLIAGGAAGGGIYHGGGGGGGVSLSGTLINTGSITGGAGGFGRSSGIGGAGVSNSVVLTNTGMITGGLGGNGAAYGASPGGLGAFALTLTNNGVIIGGVGGAADLHGGGGGGVGAYAQMLSNYGSITGGAGGIASASDSAGGLGGAGVSAFNAGTLSNHAWIAGGAGGSGGYAGAGGSGVVGTKGITFTNSGSITGGAGGAAYVTGRRGGAGGAGVSGAGAFINSGSIIGGAGGDGQAGVGVNGDGVMLSTGDGSVLNGSTASSAGFISGHIGVYASRKAVATLTNFGTIVGTGGVAVSFHANYDRLIFETGSTFVGAVRGGHGTLELASETGTISGLGSGAIEGLGATLTGFDSYQLDAGGDWTLTGANTIQPVFKGVLTNDASLSVANGASLTDQAMFVQGSGATLTLGTDDVVTLSGTSDLAGLIDGAGTVSVTDATVGDLTIGGSDALSVSRTVTQTGAVTIGSGATAGASLSIDATANWTIDGAVGMAQGASAPSSLVVAGNLIKSGAGGVSTIGLATTDTGVIEADAGTLDFSKALAGPGALKIDAGAVLEADSSAASTLTATFTGASATLALTAPKKFAATIAGFADGDTIDLLKIAATGASVNGKDQLVIVDGTTTVATLQLTGHYHGSKFTVVSDGDGGTDITLGGDANALPPGSPTPSAHLLVAAMAAVGGGAGEAMILHDPTAVRAPMLSRPGVQAF